MEAKKEYGIIMERSLGAWHRDRVLHILCTAGSFSFRFQKARYNVVAGQYVIITECALASEFIFSPDFAGMFLWLSREMVSAAAIRSNYDVIGRMSLMRNPVMQLTMAEYDRCLSDLLRLEQRVADTAHRFRDEMLSHLLAAHILDLYEIHANHTEQTNVTDRKAELLNGFISLLEAGEYRISRDTKHYAQRLCITPHYLADLSRDISGKSAGFWIDRYTTNEMVQLVADTDLPLAEISERLNFKSLSHFSRYFSAKVGMTPTQYRLSLTK